MKVRILKVGDRYYPQRKFLGFWRYYLVSDHDYSSDMWFTSAEAAEAFIKLHKKKEENRNPAVVKVFDV